MDTDRQTKEADTDRQADKTGGHRQRQTQTDKRTDRRTRQMLFIGGFIFSLEVNGRESSQSDSDINVDEEFTSIRNGHQAQQPLSSRGQTTTSTTLSSKRNPISIIIPPQSRYVLDGGNGVLHMLPQPGKDPFNSHEVFLCNI